jgi:hypothetical protein
MVGEIHLVVEGYAGVAVGDAGIRHLGLEGRRMEYGVGYVGKLPGFGTEGASFAVRLIRDERE